MDRVSTYLEIVPLPVLIGAPIAALVLFFIIPGRRRLEVMLAVMAFTLCLGRLPDLGIVAAAAKVCGSGAIAMVILAGLLHPGPKRPITGWAVLYVAMAALGFLFIVTTANFLTAAALRAQWLLIVLAAVTTARTIVDEESLIRVGRGVTIGLSIALMLPLMALVRDPGRAFLAGLGRFEPWGASSNHIGVMFAMTAAFALFAGWRAKNPIIALLFFGVAAAAAGMGVLTASRSTVVVMLGMSFPVAIKFIKRPIVLIAGGSILAIGLIWLIGFSEPGSLERLTSTDTGRAETAETYIETVIAERPFLGLLESSGESALGSEDVGIHPHNAYIETAYLGGIVYAFPMYVLVFISGVSTIMVWRARKWIARDTTLVDFLCAVMLMVYAHGFVNGAIYYPTYTWSFVHVLMSLIMITTAGDLRRGRMPMTAPAEWSMDHEEDEAEALAMQPAAAAL